MGRISSTIVLLVCVLLLGCSDKPTGYGRLVITNAPEEPVSVFISERFEHQFIAMSDNVETQVTWSVTTVGDPPMGEYAIDSAGVFTFRNMAADAGRVFQFSVAASDGRGYEITVGLTIQVQNRQPMVIQLVSRRDVLQGHEITVPIMKLTESSSLGAMTFTVGYPSEVLELLEVERSEMLPEDVWHEFTHSFAGFGLIGDSLPMRFVRIIATADIDSSSATSGGHAEGTGELARLRFVVSNDWQFNCAYVPVSFVWIECEDNSLVLASADTTFISREVYSHGWSGEAVGENHNITNHDCDGSPTFTLGGSCNGCESKMAGSVERFIDFWNSELHVACADSIFYGGAGDLDFNFRANELADLWLYVEYFLYGEDVFQINKAGQIENSDLNYDSIVLSIADLQYLVRFIALDPVFPPHLDPFGDAVMAWYEGGTLSTESTVDIGALWAQFRVSGEYSIENHTSMELLSNVQDSVLHVIVWAGFDDITKSIPSGSNDIITISGGEAELIYLEASDYPGNLMTVLVQTPDGVVGFDRADPAH